MGELDSLIGWLNHVGMILPLSRHFLPRLRAKHDRNKWLLFLAKVADGISLNLIVHRKPTRVGFSDSCPRGIGGFTWTGRAWRILIPLGSILRQGGKANNVLEFLGMAINIWEMCDECREGDFDCLLSIGDSSSAIGWMFKAGKLDRKSPYFWAVQMIARKIAQLVYHHNVCLDTQHIGGKKNKAADLLTFEGDEGRDGRWPGTLLLTIARATLNSPSASTNSSHRSFHVVSGSLS